MTDLFALEGYFDDPTAQKIREKCPEDAARIEEYLVHSPQNVLFMMSIKEALAKFTEELFVAVRQPYVIASLMRAMAVAIEDSAANAAEFVSENLGATHEEITDAWIK